MSTMPDDDQVPEAFDFAALVEEFRALSTKELCEIVEEARLQQERCRRKRMAILRELEAREVACRSASLSHPPDWMAS